MHWHCTVFELDGDFSRKLQNFPKPLYFAHAEGVSLEMGTGPTKKFHDIFSPGIQYCTNMTDIRTETGRQQRPRLHIASRGKNIYFPKNLLPSFAVPCKLSACPHNSGCCEVLNTALGEYLHKSEVSSSFSFGLKDLNGAVRQMDTGAAEGKEKWGSKTHPYGERGSASL